MNVAWRISFTKLISLGRVAVLAVQTIKIVFLAYPDRVLQIWKRKHKFFKDLKILGVSGFSFWAIEPIRKDRNNGKFTKLVSVAN